MKGERGEVVTLVLVALGLVAATQLVPNWRVSNLWAKGPPSQQLIEAEAAALRARTEATAARDALAAMQAAERAKQVEQVAYSQQMIAGVAPALRSEAQSPGVRLAANLAERASSGLAAAVGNLPSAKQAEILLIVDQALSGKQAEIDAANRALAAKDAELRLVIQARESLEARLPAIVAAKDAAEAAASTSTAAAAAKAAEVAQIADRLFAEKKESGSLGAMVTKLGYAAIIFGVLAVIGFIAWSWLKVSIGGLPRAVANGLKDLRAKGVLPAQDEINVFDAHLNRSEQEAIRKATR